MVLRQYQDYIVEHKKVQKELLMITITEIKRHNHLVGFDVSGHAQYDLYGKDIVCCAISTLAINAVNTLQEVARCDLKCIDDTGHIRMEVQGEVPIFADVILECTQIGFKSVQEQYSDYINYSEGGEKYA